MQSYVISLEIEPLAKNVDAWNQNGIGGLPDIFPTEGEKSSRNKTILVHAYTASTLL